MTLSELTKRLRTLSKWSALAIGFGGVLAVDATAGKPELNALDPDAGSRQELDLRRNPVAVQLRGAEIFISQRGGAFEQLTLKDAEQAAYLRKLLIDAGAAERSVVIPVGSIIVANGGGAGDGAKPSAPTTDSGKKQPSKKAKQPPNTNSGNGK
jgi:hypothetical protein